MAYDFILKRDKSARGLLYMSAACTTHSSPELSPDAKSLRKEEHYDDCCADQWYVICWSLDRSVDRSSGDGNGNGSREVTGNQVCRLLLNLLFPICGISSWIVRPDSLALPE